MPMPKTIKVAATYELTLAAPISLAGRVVRPDAGRITVSGAFLKTLDPAAIEDAREVDAHDTAPLPAEG